jgi:nucleotide-binding universal stress UspA family protein
MSHSSTCAGLERIVVGVDRTDHSLAALEWAVREATIRDTCLHVVHATAENDSDEIVQEALTRVHVAERPAKGIITDAVVADPSAVLAAASHDAALLVVGAHPHESFLGIRKPSVSIRTAGLADCPVAVIRRAHLDREPTYHGVVVGVDDSLSAREALAWAATEAQFRRCELEMVHVPERTELSMVHDHYRSDEDPASKDLFRYLRNEILVGPLAHVAVREHVGMGYISSALVRAADDSSLLVLGSRGEGRHRDVVRGSVATDCLATAPCPVVVIPNATQEDHKKVRRALAALIEERLRKLSTRR